MLDLVPDVPDVPDVANWRDEAGHCDCWPGGPDENGRRTLPHALLGFIALPATGVTSRGSGARHRCGWTYERTVAIPVAMWMLLWQ